MRHIFHRVVVRIMSLFEQCFKDEDKNTEFETLVNPYLLKLASLRLDWLHVKPLSKTMWLAKDELGLSRIIAFMYQQFFLNMKSRETANMFKNSLAALRQLLNSLQIVTALLMSPHKPAGVVMDKHIEVFLLRYHWFCQLYYVADKVFLGYH